MNMKNCKKCGENRPFTDFYKQKTGTFGLHTYCIFCCKKLNASRYNSKQWRDYYLNNKKHYNDYQEKYYQENEERVKNRFKNYYQKNKEAIGRQMKEWRDDNYHMVKAHRKVRQARVNGTIDIPDSCSCGCGYVGKLECHHHPDHYDEPLKVIALRRKCHRQYHCGNPEMVKKVNKLFKDKYGFKK